MLVAVTLVALALGAAAVFGGPLVALMTAAVYLAYPTPLAIIVIYSRSTARAFSIGALVPWIALWPKGPPQSSDLLNFFSFLVWLMVFGGGCGMLAAATHRWITNSGEKDGQ
jgi:hypothetical protein